MIPQQKHRREHYDHNHSCRANHFLHIPLSLLHFTGADTLTYYRQQHRTKAAHNSPAKIVNRVGHSVCGNRHCAKGRNQAGNQNFTHIEQAVIHTVYHTDSQHSPHYMEIQPEFQKLLKMSRELLVVRQPQTRDGIDHTANGGGNSRACHTHMKAVNEGGIADHIDNIKGYGDGYRLPGFAHRPQYRSGRAADG